MDLAWLIAVCYFWESSLTHNLYSSLDNGLQPICNKMPHLVCEVYPAVSIMRKLHRQEILLQSIMLLIKYNNHSTGVH